MSEQATPPSELDQELSALRAQVVALERELTRASQAEATLRERVETYHTYLEHLGDSIFALDAKGRYVYANRAFAEGVDRPLEAIVGKTQWDIFPKDEADKRFALLSEVFATGDKRTIEVRVPRADGDRYYLTTLSPKRDADGVVRYAVCSSKQITERKRAEELLRASEARLRQLIDLSPLAIALVDLDGTIAYTNKRAVELFGYVPEDIPDMDHWWRLAYPDPVYRAEVIATWSGLVARAAASGESIERREYRVTCKDGRVVPAAIFGALVGHQVLAVFDDLSGAKRAEERRLELERHLLHAQKLESLGVLAGGVAHDFNNLLMAILGNLDLALLGLPDGLVAREDILHAVAAARRAAALTSRLLDYTGRGVVAVGLVELNALVEENAALLRTSTAKTASLVMSLAPCLPSVVADAAQLQQVVMNLITNASEAFGDRPGTITLSTGVSDCEAEELARSAIAEKPAPGRFVWLEVADDGCGMDAETRRRLFDPFFTTKFTGRGLGMSAVQGIVRGHHGAILVDSTPGIGTRIRVLLPTAAMAGLAPRDTVRADVQRPRAHGAGVSGVALVVDDEIAVRKVTRAMLERLGLEVVTAEDGAEAVRLLGSGLARLRVALVDMTMPRMDGLATFHEMRRLGYDVPVILCSGFPEEENAERYATEGLAGFLQKPYELRRLEAELRRVLKA